MKTYKLKLNEEQLVTLCANLNKHRNDLIYRMNETALGELKKYYQQEVDSVNDVFDMINEQIGTKF